MQKEPDLEQIENACRSLSKWNSDLHITFPPTIYGESFISKCISAMLRNGFKIDYTDLNYHFDLAKPIKMQRNAKKHWNTAVRNNLRLVLADNAESWQTAYRIIDNSRKERGYPPYLPLEELFETAKATNTQFDCFLIYAEQESIAAAMVFTIETKRALNVLWGDNREKKLLRPMNFLAVSMAEHYESLGYLSLDLGPGSKNGIPNYGLCNFKQGLGCAITLKFSVKI
ncbi:MAG: hypothetical protein LBQ87_04895 [Candidatus Fibromonas sp.]|nr:hypothetical protein [Candidatus Fibromonas sp.]